MLWSKERCILQWYQLNNHSILSIVLLQWKMVTWNPFSTKSFSFIFFLPIHISKLNQPQQAKDNTTQHNMRPHKGVPFPASIFYWILPVGKRCTVPPNPWISIALAFITWRLEGWSQNPDGYWIKSKLLCCTNCLCVLQ